METTPLEHGGGSPSGDTLSKSDIAGAQLMFRQVDADRNGSIDVGELRNLCLLLGYQQEADTAAKDFFTRFAHDDKNLGLTFDEFQQLYLVLRDQHSLSLQEAANALDANAKEASRRTQVRLALKEDPNFFEHELQRQKAGAKAKTELRVKVRRAVNNLSAEERSAAENIFRAADIDGSGAIDLEELRDLCSNLGFPASEVGELSRSMMARFDTNNNGLLEIEEFMGLYALLRAEESKRLAHFADDLQQQANEHAQRTKLRLQERAKSGQRSQDVHSRSSTALLSQPVVIRPRSQCLPPLTRISPKKNMTSLLVNIGPVTHQLVANNAARQQLSQSVEVISNILHMWSQGADLRQQERRQIRSLILEWLRDGRLFEFLSSVLQHAVGVRNTHLEVLENPSNHQPHCFIALRDLRLLILATSRAVAFASRFCAQELQQSDTTNFALSQHVPRFVAVLHSLVGGSVKSFLTSDMVKHRQSQLGTIDSRAPIKHMDNDYLRDSVNAALSDGACCVVYALLELYHVERSLCQDVVIANNADCVSKKYSVHRKQKRKMPHVVFLCLFVDFLNGTFTQRDDRDRLDRDIKLVCKHDAEAAGIPESTFQEVFARAAQELLVGLESADLVDYLDKTVCIEGDVVSEIFIDSARSLLQSTTRARLAKWCQLWPSARTKKANKAEPRNTPSPQHSAHVTDDPDDSTIRFFDGQRELDQSEVDVESISARRAYIWNLIGFSYHRPGSTATLPSASKDPATTSNARPRTNSPRRAEKLQTLESRPVSSDGIVNNSTGLGYCLRRSSTETQESKVVRKRSKSPRFPLARSASSRPSSAPVRPSNYFKARRAGELHAEPLFSKQD